MIRLYLRGGQVVTKFVTTWEVNKSRITGELAELKWEAEDDSRLPFIRLDAVDAITVNETEKKK